MPSVLEATIAAMLQAATRVKIGLLIRVNDVRRARAIIYRFRKELGDPELMKVQVRASPKNPENELFLIRMDQEQAED